MGRVQIFGNGIKCCCAHLNRFGYRKQNYVYHFGIST